VCVFQAAAGFSAQRSCNLLQRRQVVSMKARGAKTRETMRKAAWKCVLLCRQRRMRREVKVAARMARCGSAAVLRRRVCMRCVQRVCNKGVRGRQCAVQYAA